MHEEQDMPKQPLNEELPADAIVQDSTISQSLNMEVHHHPDFQHKRKNFREYFLDNGKEKQYLELLVDDLKKDTAALNYSIRRL